jgi:hypothetical protein
LVGEWNFGTVIALAIECARWYKTWGRLFWSMLPGAPALFRTAFAVCLITVNGYSGSWAVDFLPLTSHPVPRALYRALAIFRTSKSHHELSRNQRHPHKWGSDHSKNKFERMDRCEVLVMDQRNLQRDFDRAWVQESEMRRESIDA